MTTMKNRREQLQAVWVDAPWEDIAIYIGPNAEKFRSAWEKQRGVYLKKRRGISWTFCWPALFLSFVWFFYRKQWAIGAVLIVVPIIVGFIFPSATGGFGGLAIVIAMMAKSLYLQAAIPKIAKIREAEPEDATRTAMLAAAGGTSKTAGIISGFFLLLAVAAAILPVLASTK